MYSTRLLYQSYALLHLTYICTYLFSDEIFHMYLSIFTSGSGTEVFEIPSKDSKVFLRRFFAFVVYGAQFEALTVITLVLIFFYFISCTNIFLLFSCTPVVLSMFSLERITFCLLISWSVILRSLMRSLLNRYTATKAIAQLATMAKVLPFAYFYSSGGYW